MLTNFISNDSQNIPWRLSTFAEKIWIKDLGQADGYSMQLVKFESGAIFPSHVHSKAEFVYIIEGTLIQNNQKLSKGFFSIAHSGTKDMEVATENGCLFLLIG